MDLIREKLVLIFKPVPVNDLELGDVSYQLMNGAFEHHCDRCWVFFQKPTDLVSRVVCRKGNYFFCADCYNELVKLREEHFRNKQGADE